MVLDHALLPVRPGTEEWDPLEDHTEGFGRSEAYDEWRQMLHHFYDPFPVVEHFEQVMVSRHP